VRNIIPVDLNGGAAVAISLALQLLAHTGKIKALNIPTNNTEFWERYLTLLPTPESLCQV
jgi:hypothetical protein